MSHFTKLSKAQISSVESFKSACKELGLGELSGTMTIADFSGKSITVDHAVKVGNYAVGLKLGENGKYDMVADWWGVRKALPNKLRHCKTDSDLQDALLQATTKHAILLKYQRMGFRASVTQDADRNLNIQLTRA